MTDEQMAHFGKATLALALELPESVYDYYSKIAFAALDEIRQANILLDDLLVPSERALDDRIQQMSTIHTATLQGEEIARHSLRSTIAALEQERDEMRAVVRAAVDRVTAICGPPMTRADFHETWTRLESAVDAYRKQTDKDPHE